MLSCHRTLSIWIFTLILLSNHNHYCNGDENINSLNNEYEYDSTLFPDRPLQLVRPDDEHKNLIIVEENIKVCFIEKFTKI